MNKLLYRTIAVLGSIGLTVATAWINGVNADRAVLRQLQFKDQYLNGNIPLAPVAPITRK